MSGNQGLVGWSQPLQTSIIVQRRTSVPVDGMTSTSTSWAGWSTPWTITVTNVRAGQHVLLRAVSSMSNPNTYTGAAIYRITGGPTQLAGNVVGIDLHTKPVIVEYDDATPGLGTVTYEVYVAVTSGTATIHQDAPASYSFDFGTSNFVADVYNPPSS